MYLFCATHSTNFKCKSQPNEESDMLFTTKKEDFPLVDEKDQLREQQIRGYTWCENWSSASTND